MTESLMQAYANSPRRKKLQILGGVFLVLIVFAVMLVSHLIVSSRVVAVGRQLQSAKNEIDRLEYINVNYRNEIAQRMRIEVMEKKAEELGFRPPYPGESYFVTVAGLESAPAYQAPSAPDTVGVELDVNRPVYHETLFSWLNRQIQLFFNPLGEL